MSTEWLNNPPRPYNAATFFVDRHLEEGRAGKTAYIDDDGCYSFQELATRTNKTGNALNTLGISGETRIAMIQLDSIDFPAVFWGAIKTGAIPVCINTLLTPDEYQFILHDCRAEVLIISAALVDKVKPVLGESAYLRHVIITGESTTQNKEDWPRLANLIQDASSSLEPANTSSDEIAFWLYSSGSTGNPKGVPHVHASLEHTAKCYSQDVIGLRENDVVYSAAKLFFAYGLGNAMTFTLYVGATAVLLAERPTPDAVMQTLKKHKASVFFGVPTLYAAILANPRNTREAASESLRMCVSAGEALPIDTGEQWLSRFGMPPLDGIGSTEMLHIFVSNQSGDYRFGSTGKPVPGYHCQVVDDNNVPVAQGEIGELLVSGPSMCTGYWNQRAKTIKTFIGAWAKTGDKYYVDDDGYYHCCGRTDDMFKVSGNWVSPFEVEAALMTHEKVLEAGVVAFHQGDRLLKPKAFVVLQPGVEKKEVSYQQLKDHVKQQLTPWKYPRWIEFVDDLPKTASGKIQRFKLRDQP